MNNYLMQYQKHHIMRYLAQIAQSLIVLLVMFFLINVPSYSKNKIKKQKKQITIKILKKQLNKMEALTDALQKRINELEQKVAILTEKISIQQKKSMQQAQMQQIPPESIIKTKDSTQNQDLQLSPQSDIQLNPQTNTLATGSEKQLPDISVIVNGSANFTNNKAIIDRNKVLVNEAEIGMQGYLYPTIKGDAFFSFEREEGENNLNGVLEEGYVTFLETPIKGIGIKAGKMKVDFGKTNKQHPHQLSYQDRVSVLKNFLGEDGLNAHGIEAAYLIPTSRNIFAQLQLGLWRPESPQLDPLTNLETNDAGTRISNTLATTRLWISKSIGDDNELELGLNSAWGKSLFNGSGSNKKDPIQIYAADLTFRKFMPAHKKLSLSLEWLLHNRKIPPSHISHSGYYVLGTFQSNKYWEWGIRYDNSSFPAPTQGHGSGISAIITNYLSESTFLRYQVKHGNDTEQKSFNEFIIQFVWGIGPHFHHLK